MPTVLEMDLFHYTKIARFLEDAIGAKAVEELNDRIQSFVDDGLQKVRLTREQAVKQTTGDGAILVFDKANTAHDFAQAVQHKTQEHNQGVRTNETQLWFRMGAATGELASRGDEIAGGVIIDAVRMESSANPGELLIDPQTFTGLSAKRQTQYQPPEKVTVKDEDFEVYRCVMAPEAPAAAQTGVSRKVIFEKLSGLVAGDFGALRNMLPDCRGLVAAEGSVIPRVNELLEWAEAERGPGLDAVRRAAEDLWGKDFFA